MKLHNLVLIVFFNISIGYVSAQEWAAVALRFQSTVNIIDIESGDIVDSLATDDLPWAVAWTSDCMKLFVSHSFAPIMIFEYNGSNFVPIGEIDNIANGISMSTSDQLWTTNDDGIIRVFNTETYELVESIDIGVYPWTLTFTSDGSKAVVSGIFNIVFINANDFSFNTVLAGDMQWSCMSNDGSKYAAMDMAVDEVKIYDIESESLVETVPVGDSPHGCAWTIDDSKLYVANELDDDLSVINCNTSTDVYINTNSNIELSGTDPVGMDINQDGTKLYVPMLTSDELCVVDVAANVEVDTIATGMNPLNIGVFIKPIVLNVEESFYNNEDIIIYPNPSKSEVKLESQINEVVNYSVRNLSGRLIRYGQSLLNEIELELDPGEYVLTINYNDKSVFSKKIIIMN